MVHHGSRGPVLTARALNRAMLARQLLLERSTVPLEDAVEEVGGLQTQYAPSGYIGLWTRLEGFRRAALTRALEDRVLVQATLMRTTIHLVSGREYWRFEAGIRRARREWALRVQPGTDETAVAVAAHRLREALGEGPRTVRELGDLANGFIGNLSLWLDLVRVPPSATWERRRADRIALAEQWVGPCDATEDEGLMHIVRAYLRGFGPAPLRDIAAWAGMPVRDARRGAEGLTLVRYRDEFGRELIDLPDAPLPDPNAPAPVRFLPHWDSTLLTHARRAGIVPEEVRSRIFSSHNPFSVGAYLVDGHVAGAWSVRDVRVVLDPFEPLAAADRREVDEEREALEAFVR